MNIYTIELEKEINRLYGITEGEVEGGRIAESVVGVNLWKRRENK